jgi:DNA-binding transcriptional MerR regulator
MPKLNTNKAIEPYRTISSAAEIVGVDSHVLRFWEKEFSAIKPIRNNGRRYYTTKTIDTILSIKDLLYNKGFTIQGAKNYLKKKKEEPQGALEVTATILEDLKRIRSSLQSS